MFRKLQQAAHANPTAANVAALAGWYADNDCATYPKDTALLRQVAPAGFTLHRYAAAPYDSVTVGRC